jgi:two-component system cell cycle response regulator
MYVKMAWKIMIVDDDVEWINLLKFIAGRWGYECIGTSEPAKALELAREASPDVILLDDMMPGMDGIEVMQKLRSDPATQRIPILFSSARQQSHFKDVLTPENEPIKFLGKPFNPSALNELLNEYLGDKGET